MKNDSIFSVNKIILISIKDGRLSSGISGAIIAEKASLKQRCFHLSVASWSDLLNRSPDPMASRFHCPAQSCHLKLSRDEVLSHVTERHCMVTSNEPESHANSVEVAEGDMVQVRLIRSKRDEFDSPRLFMKKHSIHMKPVLKPQTLKYYRMSHSLPLFRFFSIKLVHS